MAGATITLTTLLDVEVQGLAGRRGAIKLELRPDVNIFFGLNGSGKSSLLKILHSALDNDATSLIRVPFKSAKVRFFASSIETIVERKIGSHVALSEDEPAEQEYREITQRRLLAERSLLMDRMASLERAASNERDGAVRRQIQNDLVQLSTRLAHLTSERLENEWIAEPNIAGLRRLSHRYLSTNRLITDSLPLRSTRSRISEAEIDEVFADQIETVWRTYTNHVLSNVTDIQSAGYREILRSLLFKSPDPSEGSAAEVRRAYERSRHFIGTKPGRASRSEFQEFQRRFNEEPLFRGVVQDIDTIERQIEEAEEPRRRLAELAGSFFSEGKSITFTNSGIQAEVLGEHIPLASLSSGEKQLVRILVEVIMTDDDVIIIDEPELSMHIDWQRELVRAMGTVNPAAQIIMATHSPEIMEHVPDKCIFRL
jgi:predicted ATPase